MRPSSYSLRVERLEDRTTPALAATDTFAPDRVLVAFGDERIADAVRFDQLAASVPASSITPLGFGLYRVDLAAGYPLDQALGVLSAVPDVSAAEPDRIVRSNASFNDPQLAAQTGLAAIRAAAAWDRTVGTRNTVVAVIDTGVDYTHPDLAANLWYNAREIPGNGRDDDGNGFADDWICYDFAANDADPSDHDGHGTHVAGIVGAAGNNGLGVCGVNPNTRIMALKFIGVDGNGYTSDGIRALNYAAANGARVANASWGSNVYDAVFATAIARAQSAGLILVTSAGNDSSNNDAVPFYPASYAATLANVVPVAAVDANGNLAGFSSFGANTVVLGAPGVSILSTLPNNRYGTLSGTSMAAPFVAGAIALLWDANPTWTWQQVVAKLKATVDPLASLAGRTTTGGRLNLAKMLDVAVPPVVPPVVPPTVPPPPVTTRETDGARVLSAVFHGAAVDRFDRVRVQFNEKINAGSFTVTDVTLSGPDGGFAALSVVPVSGTNNTQFDIAFPPKTKPGTYSLTLGVDIFDIAANRMNQNGNGVNGEAGDRFTGTGTLASGSTSANPTVALPLAIPDAGTLEIPLVVNRDGSVSDLNLFVFLEHFKVGDLVLKLRSPAGRTVTLVERRGTDGSGFRGTTFDDEAAGLISKVKSPFVGTFRSEESLAAFDGQPARGTWTLIVEDRAAGKTGRVTDVRLDIATTNLLAGSVRTQAFSDGAPELRVESQALIGREEPKPPPRIELSQFLAWILETNQKSRTPGPTLP
jgi:serine protease